MDMNESEEETGATAEGTVLEEAATATVEPCTEDKAAVTERFISEEAVTTSDQAATEATAAMAETSIIEKVSVTIDALTGLMAAVDVLGVAVVICIFVYLGFFRKKRDDESESFDTFLFSSWGSFRREVAWRSADKDLSSLLAIFIAILGDGGYSSERAPKASKGQELLLPKRRRVILNEIKTFVEICAEKPKSEIALQGTSMRFFLYAGEKELNKGRGRWERLGDLIEEEKAALFIDKYMDGIYLIEIVFSDEERKAKRMGVPYNPNKAQEAKRWFRQGIAPLFVFSLFIIHWAILGTILAVAFFLYKNDMKRVWLSNKEAEAESLNQAINIYRRDRRGKKVS